jgi:hypothetical protein
MKKLSNWNMGESEATIVIRNSGILGSLNYRLLQLTNAVNFLIEENEKKTAKSQKFKRRMVFKIFGVTVTLRWGDKK